MFGMRTEGILTVLLVAGFALAGCADTPPAPPTGDDTDTPSFDEDTGGIAGLVVSEDLLPVAGASVALQEDLQNVRQTGADGRFAFSDLEPGRYTILAQAIGFKATKAPVEVTAGTATELTIELAAQALEGIPYKVTYGPVQGKFFCGFAVNAEGRGIAGPCKGVSFTDPSNPVEVAYGMVAGDENNIFAFHESIAGNKTHPNDQLRSLVVEVTWQPVAASATQLQATVEKLPEEGAGRNLSAIAWGYANGGSPLRIVVEPGIAGNGSDEAMPLDASDFGIGVFPDAEGSNAAAYSEQRFEIWFTLFYNEPAEQGFTVVGDV